MWAHHRTAKSVSSVAWSRFARSGAASAADTNAPGWSPYAANSNASARSSVRTTPPIIERMTSASRLNVSRFGRDTSRRQNAHAIDARTITATTFCIAETAVQIAPSRGHDRIVSISPPVTTLAVPIVSSTKPQKIPACMRPARQSRNIFVWTNAYSMRPTNRAPIWPNGAGWSVAGVVAAKTRRCRAISRTKTTAAPQKRGKTSG